MTDERPMTTDGLTPKQIEALDWMPVDGSARRWRGEGFIRKVTGDPAISTLRSLERRGLARRIMRPGEYFCITDAGRAALMSMEDPKLT